MLLPARSLSDDDVRKRSKFTPGILSISEMCSSTTPARGHVQQPSAPRAPSSLLPLLGHNRHPFHVQRLFQMNLDGFSPAGAGAKSHYWFLPHSTFWSPLANTSCLKCHCQRFREELRSDPDAIRPQLVFPSRWNPSGVPLLCSTEPAHKTRNRNAQT